MFRPVKKLLRSEQSKAKCSVTPSFLSHEPSFTLKLVRELSARKRRCDLRLIVIIIITLILSFVFKFPHLTIYLVCTRHTLDNCQAI